jgi:hypothetical protein
VSDTRSDPTCTYPDAIVVEVRYSDHTERYELTGGDDHAIAIRHTITIGYTTEPDDVREFGAHPPPPRLGWRPVAVNLTATVGHVAVKRIPPPPQPGCETGH